MTKAKRKRRPSIPMYEIYNRDGCWWCENRNNCNSCKVNKRFVGLEKERRRKDEERKIRNWSEEE